VGSEKVRWYFKLARPFTSLPALPGGLILYLTVNEVNAENVITGLLIGLSLACVQAVGQIVNQIVDIELDRYIKPYRPLPQGKVTVDEALGLAFGLAMIGALSATAVSYYYTLAYLLMLTLAVYYSLPPLTPRYRSAWLNHIWASASRSLVPFLAVMGLDGLVYALIAFTWAVGWQGSKDVLDAEYDRRFGIKTLANTYGVDFLKNLALLSSATIAFLSILTFKPVFLLVTGYGLHGVSRYMDRWRGENVYAWFVFYTGLILIGVLAFVDAKVL
jgi:geranylgeranylglycerol-phosphate geranylgeranyltransferase